MAKQDWMIHLPVACKKLLAPESSCQTAFNVRLEEVAAEFEWLREIADEAFQLFSIKSTKLEEMPKTPSLKARGQKRGRQKAIENTIKEESPMHSKCMPAKLKFASPEEVEEDTMNEFNRPVRRCRVTSKAVYTTDEYELPKRSTRQSRNALNSKAKINVKEENNSRYEDQNLCTGKLSSSTNGQQNSITENNASSEVSDQSTDKVISSKKGKKNVLTENNAPHEDKGRSVEKLSHSCKEKKSTITENNSSSEDQNDHSEKLSNTDVKMETTTNTDKFAKIKKIIPVLTEEASGKNSPTVRDRTKAYECMLRQRVSHSPGLKLQHNGTPSSASKTVHVPKLNTPIRVDATTKDSGNLPSSNSKIIRRTLHRESHNSMNRRSGKRKSSGNKVPEEVKGARNTRTRLKLKKQKQEQNTTSEPTQPSNSESSSSDNTEHLSQDMEQGTDLQKDIICRDGLSNNITDNGKCAQPDPNNQIDILNETETMIIEVFEIVDKGQSARLKEYEVIKTKTTPVLEINRLQGSRAPAGTASDQGFSDEASANSSSDECEPKRKKSMGNYCSNLNIAEPMPTRTRTRAQQKIEGSSQTNNGANLNKDSSIVSEITGKADSTFTKDKFQVPDVKAARTRTKAQKEPVSSDGPTKDTERTTRTRQRKQEESSGTSQDSKSTRAVPMETQPAASEPYTVTRSKMRKVADKLTICGSDDEIIAGSPVVGAPRLSLRGAKKRFAEERGLSPRPKRSCIGDQSCLNIRSPQLASSPIKNTGAHLLNEENDTVASPLKAKSQYSQMQQKLRSPRPFKFNTAQKKTSGFLNRTPGFGQNTSKLYSFLSNTPTCRSTSFLTSFLKRNTPPPKQNCQIVTEQKRQKLLEKESQDKERLKKAAELRKRKIEDQKRLREEKEQKVAEAREMRLRNEQEQKSRINKKFEDKAVLKEKLLEERCKEEREKQKQRLKKQMEADGRRKMEEEDRLKKLIEQEEEAKMHAELMQRKKECEEAERRRQIAEEKRKHDERLAELEHKRQDETARLKLAEEEKDRERERVKLEKEKQIAHERAEKDRLDREKREEKEKKLQEEIEKLKTMEKERLRCQKEKVQLQKQEAIQQNVIRQMINKHNTSLSKQPSSLNISNSAGNTSNSKINSYDMTPKKEKTISKNKNPENYDIDDKKSDDSTDDEEAPIKQIPEWAIGIPLNTALIRQHMNHIDPEIIFRTNIIEPPNLVLVFPDKKKPRYHQRTSSAIWNSPPMTRK